MEFLLRFNCKYSLNNINFVTARKSLVVGNTMFKKHYILDKFAEAFRSLFVFDLGTLGAVAH